jgi:hypothetical protein
MIQMIRISGNYVSWSVAHILAGLAIGTFGFFTRIDYPYYLLLVFAMLIVFQRLVKRERKPDERETQILLKVHANAGIWTLVTLPVFHSKFGDHFFSAIWAVFLLLRGCFGLYYFHRD